MGLAAARCLGSHGGTWLALASGQNLVFHLEHPMRALFVLLALTVVSASCSLEEPVSIRFAEAPFVTVQDCNGNPEISAVGLSMVLENFGAAGALELVSVSLLDSDVVSGTATLPTASTIAPGETIAVSCFDDFDLDYPTGDAGDVTLEIRYREDGKDRVFASSVAIQMVTNWDNCGNIFGTARSCTTR
jgi:hypothetical protein